MCVLLRLSSMHSACAVVYLYLWPLWLYHIFPHYLINSTIFGKPVLRLKCLFWFSPHLLSKIFVILRRTVRDIIKVYVGLHVKCPLFTSYFKETWVFSTFSKNDQVSNFIKILVVGAELFHANGRTQNVLYLLLFHCINICGNVLQCYVRCHVNLSQRCRWGTDPRQWVLGARRFGWTCLSHLQESSVHCLI